MLRRVSSQSSPHRPITVVVPLPVLVASLSFRRPIAAAAEVAISAAAQSRRVQGRKVKGKTAVFFSLPASMALPNGVETKCRTNHSLPDVLESFHEAAPPSMSSSGMAVEREIGLARGQSSQMNCKLGQRCVMDMSVKTMRKRLLRLSMYTYSQAGCRTACVKAGRVSSDQRGLVLSFILRYPHRNLGFAMMYVRTPPCIM